MLTRRIPYRNLQMAEVVIGVLSASNLRPSLVGVGDVLGMDVMKKAWHVEPGECIASWCCLERSTAVAAK